MLCVYVIGTSRRLQGVPNLWRQVMILARVLMNYKVSPIMINVSRLLFIFAAKLRGNRLRRGATRERLTSDMGRLYLACKFNLSWAHPLRASPNYFFGLFLGFVGRPFRAEIVNKI